MVATFGKTLLERGFIGTEGINNNEIASNNSSLLYRCLLY